MLLIHNPLQWLSGFHLGLLHQEFQPVLGLLCLLIRKMIPNVRFLSIFQMSGSTSTFFDACDSPGCSETWWASVPWWVSWPVFNHSSVITHFYRWYPPGNQTWLAGKWAVEISDFLQPPWIFGIFQLAMFDSQRVYIISKWVVYDCFTPTDKQWRLQCVDVRQQSFSGAAESEWPLTLSCLQEMSCHKAACLGILSRLAASMGWILERGAAVDFGQVNPHRIVVTQLKMQIETHNSYLTSHNQPTKS